MKQTETTLEFAYGMETLVIPKNPRVYLIDSKIDPKLCVKGHNAEIDEKSFRKHISDCYQYITREHMEKESGSEVYGSISQDVVESYLEKDLKELGNRYVLDKIFTYGYYLIKKDMVSYANELYYCTEDIEQAKVI